MKKISLLFIIFSLIFSEIPSYSMKLCPIGKLGFIKKIQDEEILPSSKPFRVLGPQLDPCDLLSFMNSEDLQAEMEILKKEPFIGISLGENCLPGVHMFQHNIRIRSFPFDWAITPVESMCSIINNNFEGFLDLKNLSIQGDAVTNKIYGNRFMHDFDGADWANGPTGLTPASAIAMEDYHRIVSYYQRRIARFLTVFNLNVPIYLFRRGINSNTARTLQNALQNKFPQGNFKLVCIEEGHFESEENWNIPNVIRFHMPRTIEPTYVPGHRTAEWTYVFSSLGLLH